MKTARHLLLRCTLLFAAGAALASAATLSVGPETLLADPAHDPAWSELFSRLAASKTRQSQFEERRYFPFRSTPVVLKGEIRIAPGRGLSLRYLEPERHVLIVDAQGLMMRDDEGHERAVPSDSRAQAITSALVSVLRFDLPALQKSFVIYGRHEGRGWVLGFVPRDAALAGMIGMLLVNGEQSRLDRIELSHSATQRVEILISNTREDVIFPGDVLQRFFR
jgi:outer membrane lipoprotein-sorting protein